MYYGYAVSTLCCLRIVSVVVGDRSRANVLPRLGWPARRRRFM
jgi:hypothetical protein